MNPKANIVKAIKELGYNSRQVSVKDNGGSLSWSFTVTVRDPKVNMKTVEDAVKKHQEIDWDPHAQEILSGGNTFIRVEATDEVKAEWSKKYIPLIEAAITKVTPENKFAEIMKGYSLAKEYYSYLIYFYNPGEIIGRRIAESNHTPGLALRMYFNEKAIEGL